MKAQRIISTIDSHTAGERTRMITGGIPNIPGPTMADKRISSPATWTSSEKSLMLEPRGNAEIVGAVITDPVNEGSDIGVSVL